MPNLRNGNKGGFEPGLGSLDCESGILPLSYRAPYARVSKLLGSVKLLRTVNCYKSINQFYCG